MGRGERKGKERGKEIEEGEGDGREVNANE